VGQGCVFEETLKVIIALDEIEPIEALIVLEPALRIHAHLQQIEECCRLPVPPAFDDSTLIRIFAAYSRKSGEPLQPGACFGSLPCR
jgi:hypothetical protein